MHVALTSRFVLLVILGVACATLLSVAVFGVVGEGSSSNGPGTPDPVPAVDPDVQHCLGAGGEPSWIDGEVACLIPPATLER